MIFAFHLIDKPGALEQRVALRPLHKEYLSQVGQDVAFAGPLTSDDGQTMVGSLLVIDFPNREAAHAWIKEEPLRKPEFMPASVFIPLKIYGRRRKVFRSSRIFSLF